MVFTLEVPRSKRRKHEEASLQVTVMQNLDLLLPADAVAFHVPNGGSRNAREAANLKRQGVRAGVPDILIVHDGRVHGLELKSAKGTISDSQQTMFPRLRAAGMRIEVARTLKDVLRLVREMGVPIREIEDQDYAARDVFREEARRRA